MTFAKFSERSISIVLRGDEWFALFAKLLGKPLSNQGTQVALKAMHKLACRLEAESVYTPPKTAADVVQEANERVGQWPPNLFEPAPKKASGGVSSLRRQSKGTSY